MCVCVCVCVCVQIHFVEERRPDVVQVSEQGEETPLLLVIPHLEGGGTEGRRGEGRGEEIGMEWHPLTSLHVHFQEMAVPTSYPMITTEETYVPTPPQGAPHPETGTTWKSLPLTNMVKRDC